LIIDWIKAISCLCVVCPLYVAMAMAIGLHSHLRTGATVIVGICGAFWCRRSGASSVWVTRVVITL